jgi:hypothetical protein
MLREADPHLPRTGWRRTVDQGAEGIVALAALRADGPTGTLQVGTRPW